MTSEPERLSQPKPPINGAFRIYRRPIERGFSLRLELFPGFHAALRYLQRPSFLALPGAQRVAVKERLHIAAYAKRASFTRLFVHSDDLIEES